MNDNTIDLESSAVNPDTENNGILCWYGGIEGEGVAFIVRAQHALRFQQGQSSEIKKMSFALRKEDTESLQIREQCRCRAIARDLIVGWGPTVRYNGVEAGGKSLVVSGVPIEWIPGTAGHETAEESWKKLSVVLANPRYRRLREQIIIWSADETLFGDGAQDVDEEQSAKN